MINHLVKQARVRLRIVCRLQSHLSRENLETMYSAFVRSALEYGSVLYMGAKGTHLAKLDRVQATAERMFGIEVEPLVERREGAAIALALKLLDGAGRGTLQSFASSLDYDMDKGAEVGLACGGCVKRRCASGVQVAPYPDPKPARCEVLDAYKRSFFGVLPEIWAKLPQDLIGLVVEGKVKRWQQIKVECKGHLINKQ